VAFGLRRDGVLGGLAALRLYERADRRWAELADVVVDPGDGDGFRQLTGAVVADAVDRGCDVVRASLSHPALLARLRAPRWLRRREVSMGGVYAHARDRALADRIGAARWHMTGLISDRVDTGEYEC